MDATSVDVGDTRSGWRTVLFRWISLSRWTGWRRHVPFLLIFVLASYLITLNVTAQFRGVHEDNGTFFASVATNHLRLGLGYTKGQDVYDEEALVSSGAAAIPQDELFEFLRHGDATPDKYGDHPPLLGLTIAVAFKVLGFGHGVERSIPIVFALASMILFYILVYRLFDVGTACCAAFLFGTFPMFSYYGRNVCHESPTLFCCLALTLGYFLWREDGRRRWIWGGLMVVSTIIGGLYGWPMFYWAILHVVLDWISRRRLDLSLAALVALPAVGTFLFVMGHLVWFLGGVDQLYSAFAYRVGVKENEDLSIATWLAALGGHNSATFGMWTQLVLPVVALFLAHRASAERWSPRIMLVALAGVCGFFHVALFRNGSSIHAYWQYYLLPFYAIAIAWTVISLARKYVPSAAARRGGMIAAGFLVLVINLQVTARYLSEVGGEHVPITSLLDQILG